MFLIPRWGAMLAFLAAPAMASLISSAINDSVRSTACSLLKATYPGLTFYPNATEYGYETVSQYWSATLYESPACVFVPQNARQMSFAVVTMTLTLTKFAVRGGGHMPIPGYNSIDNGVLLSTSNLTALAVAEDNATVSVGAGNRWRDVYSHLTPYGLAAVGGRIGDVGVSGFLLGGGVSFYSSQYGFGSDNVISYECVLSSGIVVDATATNAYSDLFWALKGGGNSFCIVTTFVIRTVESPQVWVGIAQYDQAQGPKYLDAVYNFGEYGATDTKAAIIPTILTYPGYNLTVYAAAKFYDSTIDGNNATAFENFTAPILTPVADSYTLQPLSMYVLATDSLQPLGLRQAFRVMSCVVDRDAVQHIHDTFLGANMRNLSAISGLSASVTFQPATSDFIEQGINNGGNPQGVDISKAPYFWMVENWTWSDQADDEVVDAFAEQLTSDIEAGLLARGVEGGFLYMNDAGKGQPVFQNYPAANLAKLKVIRQKYDPLAIYTRLLYGGWKVLSV
ncbi:FAD binding domain-containing protein [Xylariales sp. AK1849]|nr:FAD binding domain-containing protein [Xylariales sp. AK1849]